MHFTLVYGGLSGRVYINTLDCVTFDIFEFATSQPCLKQPILEFLNGLVLFFHISRFSDFSCLYKPQLFLIEFGLLSELLHIYFHLILLGVVLQPSGVILERLLLLSVLLFEFFAHGVLLLDHELEVRGFL